MFGFVWHLSGQVFVRTLCTHLPGPGQKWPFWAPKGQSLGPSGPLRRHHRHGLSLEGWTENAPRTVEGRLLAVLVHVCSENAHRTPKIALFLIVYRFWNHDEFFLLKSMLIILFLTLDLTMPSGTQAQDSPNRGHTDDWGLESGWRGVLGPF